MNYSDALTAIYSLARAISDDDEHYRWLEHKMNRMRSHMINYNASERAIIVMLEGLVSNSMLEAWDPIPDEPE